MCYFVLQMRGVFARSSLRAEASATATRLKIAHDRQVV